MKEHLSSRLLSMLLVLAMLLGVVPVGAVSAQTTEDSSDQLPISFEQIDADGYTMSGLTEAEDIETEDQDSYDDADIVRVSIVLESKSTIAAGFSTTGIAQNGAAIAYRQGLDREQAQVTAAIERALGTELDVVWNLTLTANIISANVAYGQMNRIAAIPGVKEVVLETRYEPAVYSVDETAGPETATSGKMIGASAAYAAGYTGAGSRIAVIDTGIDTDHQSFTAAGFNYSLAYQAGRDGVELADYLAGLNLLDAEEIASVQDQLNVTIDPAEAYISTKIPFGYNYVDEDYDVTHDNDNQGEHGSHVEGIAAANAYIPNEDGTFSKAIDTVLAQGVAPDAQIIVMKVFGKNGGAYDSDYMAAIEDAIILGCDAVNLSLGSISHGFTYSTTYQYILDDLALSDTVVACSGGNNGSLVDGAVSGVPYLYGEDVSMYSAGAPGTYDNTLSVASADNDGTVGYYFNVGEESVFYNDGSSANNAAMNTLAGSYEYVLIDSVGTAEEFAAIADVLAGKIAVCFRGTNSFYEKANAAVANGAIGVVVANNTAGVIYLNLSGYSYKAPVVSITQADGQLMKEAAAAVTDQDGNVLYYLGTMTITQNQAATQFNSAYYTMSSFSSWGVPGSLELKPEITAPGGSIYSVNGSVEGGQAYEVMSGTSMASPQVAGMAAVVAQYIRENGLAKKTGLSTRQLAQSLLMSTSVPLFEEESGGNYYSVLKQGSGLANAGNAVTAQSYIRMNADATDSWSDGKVKAELGDDPNRTGEYSFSFTLNNFSDETKTYTLAADFFTQSMFAYSGYLFLDTWTMSLPMDVTFTVNGEVFVPVSSVDCDLDGDGDTDADDAQIIISYCAGASETIAAIADVDGNGSVTTYDAYLILDSMETRNVTVAPGGSVEIRVDAAMTQSVKNFLDTYYTSGAYVEGYVYVLPTSTEEGVITDVTHSIPVLGFYGNWSDASMYEDITYTDYLYNDYKIPYTGYVSNNLIIKYAGDSSTYWQIGNPYFIENTYKPERAAISSTTTLASYPIGLIRDADALTLMITNQDGEILLMNDVTNMVYSAYFHNSYNAWRNTVQEYNINKKVGSLGVEEGDRITVSIVAVPEYYQVDGPVTTEQLLKLIQSGTLGDGAYLSTTMTVDDTAPVISDIYKDLTTGNLIVTASDNNYIAAIQVTNLSGSKTYGYGLPNQTGANQLCGVEIDLSGTTIGEEAVVLVADYANNISAYKIVYGGEGEDFSGRMFGFSPQSPYFLSYSGYRWDEIDPATIYAGYSTYYDGFTPVAYTNGLYIDAAEYADGYVFMAATDGKFYVCRQDDMGIIYEAGSYADVTSTIWDMAFNYTDNKMYVVGDNNTVYTMDLLTCELTKQFTVALSNPASSSASYKNMRGLAVDGDGNFYTYNSGMSTSTFLYRFTKDDVVDGAITDLTPVVNARSSDTDYYDSKGGSLAWDYTTDTLYWCCTYNSVGSTSSNNRLLVLNTTTGKATPSNTTYAGTLSASIYGSRTPGAYTAFYIVPGSNQLVTPSTTASSIVLDITEISVLTGTDFSLSVSVYPWNLENKSVTWTTSDAAVATVTDGTVSAVGAGTATITATTNVYPYLTATCTVTVADLESVRMSGLVYDVDSTTYWSDITSDDPSAWTAVSGASSSFIGGTEADGVIYAHDGSTMYAIDPDSFEITPMGGISSTWIWSDAAPAPLTADGKSFGLTTAICYGGQYLEIVDVPAGTLNYFDLSSTFSNDPMAAIAYAGSGTYTVDTTAYITGATYPTCNYYILTESGDVWYLSLYSYKNNADFEICEQTYICNVGLNLDGVSAVTGGVYASMIYDEATDRLLVSAYTEGDTAVLYALDLENGLYATIGTFGDDVWPVVSLYQYQRATDLTVRVTPSVASIYTGETASFAAKVLPNTFTGGVVWSSSDESVATVDQNGVVTGVGEGTATITATSVDVNANGETVSASAAVTVQGLADVNITFHGQVTTASGSYWATINTSNLNTYTVDGQADVTLKGGGAHEGEIWGHSTQTGTMGNFSTHLFYTVSLDDYDTEYHGWTLQGEDIDDLTTAPAYKLLTKDKEGNEFYTEALGHPLYVSNATYVEYMKVDYVDDYYNQIYMFTGMRNYGDLAAISFVGMTESTGYTSELFYVLCDNGDLLQLIIEMRPTTIASDGYYQRYWRPSKIGNIGVGFTRSDDLSMVTINDGTNYGLLIAESGNGKGELFYVDLNSDTYQAQKVGTLDGVTYLTSLYTDYELNFDTGEGDAAVEALESEGTATSASAGVLLCETYTGEALAEEPVAETTANPVGGTTEVISGEVVVKERIQTAVNGGEAQVADQTVSVAITDTENVTNGVIRVTYDPAVLTYADTVTSVGNYDVTVDATNGVVTFAYATAKALAAGSNIATVNFSYTASYIDTQITVATVERNTVSGISGESVILDVVYEVGDHDYVVTDSKEATCTEDGYVTYTCTKCGDSYTETVPATGHSYEAVVTAPTCTEDGYTTYTCSVCGDSYVADHVEATGHHHEAVVTAPTCTEMGYTTYTCACGDTYVSDYVNPTGHHYEIEVIEPTCTGYGYSIYTCTDCGSVHYADVVDPTGHSYEAAVTAPTCTEQGYTTYTCVICGSSYVDDYVDATGHSFGEWIVTTEPTCTEDGVETRYCEHCDATETRTIDSHCASESFVDVDLDDWFHTAVDYVVDNGIMNGISETEFAPASVTTRAQLVTVLYRLAGAPEVTGTTGFTDVKEGSFYADAVVWAYANGITTGVTEDCFAPNDSVTREQVVVFLARYAALTGADTTSGEDLSGYTDAGSIGKYAVGAMQWAVENGIITGMTADTLDPKGTSTRAQIATILMRFMELGK